MKFKSILFSLIFGLGAANAAIVDVTIGDDMAFTPKLVQVHVGDTVRFTNESSFNHTVTAQTDLVQAPSNVVLPPGAVPFHSGKIAPGTFFEHTFTVAGHYQYVCLPHEHMGMIGQVDVLP